MLRTIALEIKRAATYSHSGDKTIRRVSSQRPMMAHFLLAARFSAKRSVTVGCVRMVAVSWGTAGVQK